MSHFAIRKPQWLGGRRCVGLADNRIEASNTIEVLYVNKDGVRLYPHVYSMTGMELKNYPLKNFSPKIPPLRVVPIDDLHVAAERPQV